MKKKKKIIAEYVGNGTKDRFIPLKKNKKARKPKYPKWYSGDVAERFDIEEVAKGVWRVVPKKPKIQKATL